MKVRATRRKSNNSFLITHWRWNEDEEEKERRKREEEERWRKEAEERKRKKKEKKAQAVVKERSATVGNGERFQGSPTREKPTTLRL